jgi:hypothetical protein
MWVEFRQDISTAMMGRKAWAAESLDKYRRNHRAPRTNSVYGDGLEQLAIPRNRFLGGFVRRRADVTWSYHYTTPTLVQSLDQSGAGNQFSSSRFLSTEPSRTSQLPLQLDLDMHIFASSQPSTRSSPHPSLRLATIAL